MLLLNDIVPKIELSDKEDQLKWQVNKGKYTTAKGYEILQKAGPVQPEWSILWKLQIPPKIKIFLWMALHNALPTLNSLHLRGMQVNPICRWCNVAVETSKHLLWQCTLATNCWKVFSKWFELKWSIPHDLRELFLRISQTDCQGGTLVCLSATIWTLWITRNAKIFRGNTTNNLMLEKIIKTTAWEWSVRNNSMKYKWRNLWANNPKEAYEAHRKDMLNMWLI